MVTLGVDFGMTLPMGLVKIHSKHRKDSAVETLEWRKTQDPGPMKR